MSVVPMLTYEDGEAAMDWLAKAFGFVEKERWLDSGRLSHGEMIAGLDGVIMLASPTAEYQSPKTLRENYEPAARWQSIPYVLDGVLVYVSDARAHCAQAQACGAIILGEIEEGFPGARYRVEDLEGHRWMFLEAAAAE